MKIFTAQQIRDLDAYTIENEPIASIDLMERASMTFVDWFTSKFDSGRVVQVVCGIGNNGGDGFAIARLLYERGYSVRVYFCIIAKKCSLDCQTNKVRLEKIPAIQLIEINKDTPFPTVQEDQIIIDAIFGSGLNRPIEGFWGDLIDHINTTKSLKIAVDIPSGLFAHEHSSGKIFKADWTFSFELPKLAFLFPENHKYVGNWAFDTIGLSESFIDNTQTADYYLDSQLIKGIYKKRGKYDHKGTFGHALLVVGSKGMVGAAILASKACLRSGVGLLTIHAPKGANDILQISIPEAIINLDTAHEVISKIGDLKKYSTLGIGCGIGTEAQTQIALEDVLERAEKPIVLDADALNIISQNHDLFHKIPEDSILTPHPKEFERLFGKTENDFERNKLQREKAVSLKSYIILKGAHTSIACPDGTCYFNSTGNPGMATAGSGDVLTGIITGLFAQGYNAFESAILGVYLHGMAGDIAAESFHYESLIAGDIINCIGKAFLKIKSL